MNNQLSRLCPDCKGYILGGYSTCPYCGSNMKAKKLKFGFYSVLFLVFLLLMLIALLTESRYDEAYRKIQPYINFEHTVEI